MQRARERSAGGRGKQQVGPTREHKLAARNRVRICRTPDSSPASAYLPPPTWLLLAAVGRAIGVVAGAPLLLGSRRGRRRRGRRLQQRVGRRCRTKSRQWQRRGRPVQAQPLTRSLQVLPRSLPIFPCSVVLISACQSLN